MGMLDKYGKDDKPVTDEELDKLSKRGGYTGAILIPAGAAMTAKGFKGKVKKGGKLTEEDLKTLKKAGIGSMAAGSALVGYSAYRHYKNKKKKEADNDNSKD